MGLIDRARQLRAIIEFMANGLNDETATEYTELFPEWIPDGHDYNVDEKVRYGATLYKVLQAHTSQSEWAPDISPSLFAEVLPGQDGTDIGVWEQPDSTNPYMAGDRVHYPTIDDPIYESIIDNNIWSPDAYPAGWREVTE